MTPPPDHPRLRKVLGDALYTFFTAPAPEPVIAAIPPAIADRLEDILDACQWRASNGELMCGQRQTHHWHEHPHGVIQVHHAYVPLIEVEP